MAETQPAPESNPDANHLTVTQNPPAEQSTATSHNTSSTSLASITKPPTHPSIHDEPPISNNNTEKDVDGEPTTHQLTQMSSLSRIPTSDYPKSFKLFSIVIALVLSIFLVSLDMTIVATAIPRITDDFKSLQDVGWYGAAFFLTVGAFQSTWGKAYKYFPLKTTFLVSIAIFEVGSLICAVAQNSVTLIVGRAIAGLGGAGIGSGAYTIIAFSAPPRQRPAFTGILGAVYGLSSVIGPLIGGAFTTNATWRWCFYINLPVGGASAAVILLSFTTPAASKPAKASLKEKLLQMDPLGTITILGAIICYILALQWGGTTKDWGNKDVVGTLVGFGVLIILFIVIEYTSGDRAMLPRAIMGRREVAINCAYIFFLAGSFFELLYYLPIYFQSVSGVSASASGVRNIPFVLAVSLFTILSGGAISVFGYYVPILLLGSVFATIGNGLLYTLDVGTGSSKWIGYQALAGIGLGLSIQVPMIANQGFAKAREISEVTAATLFFQTIGGAFFVSAGQTAFTNRIVSRIPVTAPGLDPGQVVATGATEIRSMFPDQIAGVVRAYMDGIKLSFAISIALAGVTGVIALGAKWRKVGMVMPGPVLEEKSEEDGGEKGEKGVEKESN